MEAAVGEGGSGEDVQREGGQQGGLGVGEGGGLRPGSVAALRVLAWVWCVRMWQGRGKGGACRGPTTCDQR